MDDELMLFEGEGPLIATAIHDGHAVRDEVLDHLGLSTDERLREEDPYTGRLTDIAPTRLIARRSRFEVDLNRAREDCVYRSPEEAWGLSVGTLPDDVAERSREIYDRFYAKLERVLRERERRYGRFVVLDLHSYNHRREGPAEDPADPVENPEINVGSATVDRARWGALLDRFVSDLGAQVVRGHALDVRENVKFGGGHMARWVHKTFPRTGCALAIELKKTFMDEWSGRLDEAHHAELRAALAATVPGLVLSLAS